MISQVASPGNDGCIFNKMRNLFPRTLQTTIIFLVVGGIMALALGGYFSSASNVFTGSLVNIQAWFSARYMAVQDFFTSPRDMASLRQTNAELEAEVASRRRFRMAVSISSACGNTPGHSAMTSVLVSNCPVRKMAWSPTPGGNGSTQVSNGLRVTPILPAWGRDLSMLHLCRY